MGTTGSSSNIAINSALPDIIAGVREYATVPLAVGFGVATREHFEMVSDAGADGVVIGSRLVSIIKHAPKGEVHKNVESYCREISLKGQPVRPRAPGAERTTSGRVTPDKEPIPEDLATVLPHRFGQFGGQYVPEALFDCLVELEEAHKTAMEDPEFWKEFQSLYGYMNRPSNLYFAEKLTQKAGGAKIWLKREDL
jgi:tryptophan synthase